MRKIKVVVLLVQQLQHGFTKNAKVSPKLTVAHMSIFIVNDPLAAALCVVLYSSVAVNTTVAVLTPCCGSIPSTIAC